MEKFKCWWFDYFGFMLIPFVTLAYITLDGQHSGFSYLFLVALLGWIVLNAFSFYRYEIKMVK
ncbi:hypothetical protein [Bacillus sp. NPDC077027]|uniref:hypothetical protein n=1 Tax=Bacillus sp. NPDC077027 TaxID=3390548 RepID=UPI003D084ECB